MKITNKNIKILVIIFIIMKDDYTYVMFINIKNKPFYI